MAKNSSRVISYVLKMEDDFSKVFADLDKKSRGLATAFKPFQRGGESLMKMGGKMSLFVTAPLTLLGTAALHAAEQVNDLETQFSRLSRSTVKGKSLLTEFQDVAKTLPFSFETLSGASVDILSARGQTPEKMLLTLKRLADVSVATKADLGELSAVYRNMMTFGSVDVRALQAFEHANIPLVEHIQKILENDPLSKLKGQKLSPALVKQLILQKRIPSAIIDRILEDMTKPGGIYAGAAAAKEAEPLGAFKRFQETKHHLLATLGNVALNDKAVIQGFKELSHWVEKAAHTMEVWAEKNPELVKNLVKIAGALALIGPALITIGGTVYAISQVTLAFKALLVVSRALAFTPVGAALIAAAAAVWLVNDAIEAFQEGGVDEFFARWGDRIKYVVDLFKSLDTAIDNVTSALGLKGLNTLLKYVSDQDFEKGGFGKETYDSRGNVIPFEEGKMAKSLAGRQAFMRMDGNVNINLSDPGKQVQSVNTQVPSFSQLALGVNLGY